MSVTDTTRVPSRQELVAALTAPGMPFALEERTIRGVPMRVYATGPQTLQQMARDSLVHGDRPFTVYAGERTSYAEVGRVAAGLAAYLHDELGLRKGDRVAVSMRNLPEWAPLFLAAQLAGLVTVPLNAWWSAPELEYALVDSGARVVVTDPERSALVAPALERLDGVTLIQVRGEEVPAGALSWAELVAGLPADPVAPAVEVEPEDDATILYTSGTTGRPKGAVGTHRNHITNLLNTQLGATVSAMIANGGAVPEPDPDAPQSGILCSFPIFHIAGVSSLWTAVMLGGKLATQRKWDPAEARELVRAERLTNVAGVPTVIRELMEDVVEHPEAYASLTGFGIGGASVPPDLVTRIGSVFAGTVSPGNGYGLTETTSAIVSNTGADYLARPDSVGRCQPNADVRVVDPVTGQDVPEGEIGELWFRGPNVVRGYWRNPAATEAAFAGGWFRTGDLGRVDDGWVYVLDRIKDVVIRGGENIYCAEVEAALFEHPAVQDVALVGVPHPTLGEEAVAIVRLQPGVGATPEELQAHVGERLAGFKVPSRVVYAAEPLPRTATGKVLKRELRSRLVEG